VTSIDQLPAPESISSKPIATAAAALRDAAKDREQRRKDLVELEQTREAAEWRDAEAAEKARAEGKPEPKRTHVAAHDRKTDEARHELKVAELAVERTRQMLGAALDEHGEAWIEDVERELATHDEVWAAAVNTLIGLHGKRAAARAIARAIGLRHPDVGACGFQRRQVNGVEFTSGQPRDQLAWIYVEDVLAVLSDLGVPPEPALDEPRPARDTKPNEVDLTGLDSLSYADAHAGSPTQAEYEAASAAREAVRS